MERTSVSTHFDFVFQGLPTTDTPSPAARRKTNYLTGKPSFTKTISMESGSNMDPNEIKLAGNVSIVPLGINHTVWTVNDVLSRSTPFFSKGCGSTQKGMDRLKSKGMDRLNKRVWIDSRRH